MTALGNKSLIAPEVYDALLAMKQDTFRSLNCVKVGQIQSFNGTKRTAQIQILFKRVVPSATSPTGTTVQDYPLLIDCPVFTLQGGGGYIQFPIAAGDQCLVLFSDRNLDAWFQNGSPAAPFDDRCHDISDGIAIVGLNSLASSMDSYPTDKVRIAYQGQTFELTSSGINWIADGGAEIDLDGALVAIKNNTTTLLTLLNGLIDVIAAITIQTSGTPPLTAVSIAALQAYKLQLAALLE